MPLPADIKATLVASRRDPDVLVPRFWAQESVRFTAEFRDADTKALVDVLGVTFAFLRPGAVDEIVPEGFAVRLSEGVYACAIRPALAGRWRAVARCTSPTAAVAVRSFEIDPLPAGTPPPPITLVTDGTGLFLLLTGDGAMISA